VAMHVEPVDCLVQVLDWSQGLACNTLRRQWNFLGLSTKSSVSRNLEKAKPEPKDRPATGTSTHSTEVDPCVPKVIDVESDELQHRGAPLQNHGNSHRRGNAQSLCMAIVSEEVQWRAASWRLGPPSTPRPRDEPRAWAGHQYLPAAAHPTSSSPQSESGGGSPRRPEN